MFPKYHTFKVIYTLLKLYLSKCINHVFLVVLNTAHHIRRKLKEIRMERNIGGDNCEKRRMDPVDKQHV